MQRVPAGRMPAPGGGAERMLRAYRSAGDALLPVEPAGARLGEALWIDLCQPTAAEVAAVEALGIAVPEREAMEELQLSSRLYRLGEVSYMTVVLPGRAPDGRRVSRPVCLILSSERLVTVRFHEPDAFRLYPERAVQSAAGCGTPVRVWLGLVEEIVDQIADTMEEIGRALNATSGEVFDGSDRERIGSLRRALETTGRFGVRISSARHSLLMLERAVNYIEQFPGDSGEANLVGRLLEGQLRDIAALVVHADYLAGRASVITDATLGMITLDQNQSVSMLSALASLLAPAMLISSIYGMNFVWMPELDNNWGFAMAIAGMALSGFLTYVFFRKRGWM
ncbi:MAG: CorA family divalent cation transporter [Tropicimonas sp.]|uniref:CorA family divalent cation transporter n=1 Tax=Tropicimonas sp. TaxID=2067044 RepID=UPI003A887673